MPDPSGYGFFCTLAELQPTQVSGLNEIVCGVVNPFVDGSGLFFFVDGAQRAGKNIAGYICE